MTTFTVFFYYGTDLRHFVEVRANGEMIALALALNDMRDSRWCLGGDKNFWIKIEVT